MSRLTLVPGPAPASMTLPSDAGAEHASAPMPIAVVMTRQEPDPRTASADSAAGETTPAATPSVVPLPAGLALSIEADVIAECLYCANAIQLGDGEPPVPFRQLPAMVCQAYRDAAIVAIQRIAPHAHAEAVRAAEAVVPGFEAGLLVYTAALQYGQVRFS